MSTFKDSPKPLRYQLYMEHRYGPASEPYEFVRTAADAYRSVVADLAKQVHRRMTPGYEPVVPSWTRQVVERDGYVFTVTMWQDNISLDEYCEGWAKQCITQTQPQTRDPKVGHLIEVSERYGRWTVLRLDEDVPELVQQFRPAYGGAIAHEKAVRVVKKQVGRFKDLYHGDLYHTIVTVVCDELGFCESCGGFESDDEIGQSEWVEDQIQSALNSKHQ